MLSAPIFTNALILYRLLLILTHGERFVSKLFPFSINGSQLYSIIGRGRDSAGPQESSHHSPSHSEPRCAWLVKSSTHHWSETKTSKQAMPCKIPQNVLLKIANSLIDHVKRVQALGLLFWYFLLPVWYVCVIAKYLVSPGRFSLNI